MSVTTAKRRELQGLIAGKSDDEIVNGANEMGVDKVLGPVFEGMREAFMPAKARGQSAVIEFDVDVGGRLFVYQVIVRDGACSVIDYGRERARLTISAKLPDFLRLMAGTLNEVKAFMAGKVTLKGELILAAKMTFWFLKPGE